MADSPMYLKNHVVGAFLIGLVVGLGSYHIWDNNGRMISGERTDSATGEEMVEDSESEITESANSVTVTDQLAGFSATVDRVSLDQDGWIVIYSDRDGQPASRLGASRRDSGEYENVIVELLTNTEEGEMYYAMIHADDGDREFDHTRDLPVQNTQGFPVMTAFEVVRR